MASKTRKRVAKKAPAPATNGRGKPWSWFDKAKADRIVALRDREDKGWSATAAAVKLTVGKALLLYKTAKLTASEKITGTDAEVGKVVVRLREKEKMSEGDLMARTGFAPGRLHAVYEAASNKPWGDFRIGKGGRRSTNGKSAPKAAAKKSNAKAKTPRRTKAKVSSLVSMTDEQAAAALTGRLITVVSPNGGKPRKIRIGGTVKVAKTQTGLRAASFTDDETKQRVIDLATIKSVR